MFQKFSKTLKNLSKIKVKLVLFSILLITTTLDFYKNNYSVADQSFFENFQKDSESLVLGKIIYDKYHNHEPFNYGLGFASMENDSIYGPIVLQSYRILNENIENESFSLYTSQVGLQGIAYSFLFHDVKMSSIKTLNLLSAFLTSLTLISLTYLFGKIVSIGFSTVFFVSMFFSPWIVSIAGNLYWSPFLWFLPAICTFLFYINISNKLKYFFAFGFIASIFIKSLCGYEYLSTVVIFSISVFLIAPFKESANFSKWHGLKYASIFFGLSLIGFFFALLIHAYLRGEGNTLLGLQSIYNRDVLRRTILEAKLEDMPPVYHESISSTIPTVILKYIYPWSTELLGPKLIKGIAFPILIILNIFLFIFRKRYFKNIDFALFGIFLLAPLSWFILGKSHSYIHININFVLWYFGFISVIFYIPLKFLYITIEKFIKNKCILE